MSAIGENVGNVFAEPVDEVFTKLKISATSLNMYRSQRLEKTCLSNMSLMSSKSLPNRSERLEKVLATCTPKMLATSSAKCYTLVIR